MGAEASIRDAGFGVLSLGAGDVPGPVAQVSGSSPSCCCPFWCRTKGPFVSPCRGGKPSLSAPMEYGGEWLSAEEGEAFGSSLEGCHYGSLCLPEEGSSCLPRAGLSCNQQLLSSLRSLQHLQQTLLAWKRGGGGAAGPAASRAPRGTLSVQYLPLLPPASCWWFRSGSVPKPGTPRWCVTSRSIPCCVGFVARQIWLALL